MKICPYCSRESNNDNFCDFCDRPIHEVVGTTKKEDKEWRKDIKDA